MNDTTTTNPVKRFFEMEPAILRGVLVALSAVVAQIFNNQVELDMWVEIVLNLYTAASALFASIWTRTVVISQAKVLAFKSTPNAEPGAILPGNATLSPDVTESEVTNLIVAASSEMRAA